MTDETTHACPVRGCRARLPRQKLMCFGHWVMVPRELQETVYSTWRGFRQNPAAYLRARMHAIEAVESQLPATAPAETR